MGTMRRRVRQVMRGALWLIAASLVLVAALLLSLRSAGVQRHLGEIITAVAHKPGRFFVRVGNVRGRPPWNLQVDRVEIGDAEGVWLVIEDAEADWHPFDIWHQFDDTRLRVNVDRIHARRLLWTRLPRDDDRDDKPFRWDRFPRIIARDLAVDELELGEGLLGGGHAVLRARGNGVLGEWQHGRLDLTLERIDGKRGEAKIDLFSDGNPPQFHGSVTAVEDEAGALAFAARLREAGPVELRVDVSGPLRDWNATAVVRAGAIGRLEARAGIAFGPSGAIKVSGSFDPVASQRDRYLVGAGAPLLLALDGAWLPGREVRLDHGRLDADGRVLEASGRIDLAAADRPYQLAANLSRSRATSDEGRSVELGPLRLAIARLEATGTLGAQQAPNAVVGTALGSALGAVLGQAPDATAAAGGGATINATIEIEDLVAGDFDLAGLRGVVDGKQRGAEGPLLFNLDVHGQGLALGDAAAPLLGASPWLKGRGEAVVTDGQVSFERIELGGEAVHVEGTLHVDDDWKGLRASLASDSEDLAGLSRWVAGGISGAARVALDLDSKAGGDVLKVRMDGKTSGLSFGDPGLKALFGAEVVVGAEIDGKVSGPGRAKASVVGEGIRAEAVGELQPDGRTISATFTSALDNLARLSDRAAASVAGRLEANGELHGVLDDFSLRVDLRGAQLAYEGFRFDELTADVSATGLPRRADAELQATASYGELRSQLAAHASMPDADTLVISDAVVQGPGTTAAADLRIGLGGGPITGAVKIVSEDLSRWRAFVGHGLGGRLAVDLAIAPQTAAQADGGRLSGTVSLSDGSLVLPSGEALVVKSLDAVAEGFAVGDVAEGEARADVIGARIAGVAIERARLEVRADGNGWLVATNAAGVAGAAWKMDVRTRLTPKFARAAEQRPESRQARFAATVEVLDVTLGSDAVHLQEPTRVAWTADSLEVAPTVMALGESGKLRLAGQFGPSGVRAEAGLEAAPFSLVSFLLPDLGLRGSVGGSVSLRGPSLVGSVIDAHLEGRGLGSHSLQDAGVAALDAVADGHWERGRLRGEASLGGLGQQRARFAIDAPVGSGAKADDRVSASLFWRGDLADVTSVLPLGEDRVKGSVRADLRVGGSVATPLLSGDLSVSDGSYENAVSGLVLRDVALKVTAQGSNLVLETLSATDGEQGRVTASGRAEFARLPAFEADMELHASAATLARLDVLTANANADLRLHLARAVGADSVEGSIVGKVKIEDARIQVADYAAVAVPELAVVEINNVAGVEVREREQGQTALRWNVLLDVAVKANNRIYVEGRGLESEWGADLRLGGTTVDPRITGTARSVRGRLGLLGRRFEVTSAELRFDGSAVAVPYLALTAQAEANDVTAIVVANGPAMSPNIELRSDPALPSDDILARLLFGKGATGLTPMQSVQVAQSLAELTGIGMGGGAGLIGKLGRTLGLDRLGLEAGSGDAGSTLTASKYLTDKVYLRVRQGLTPEDSKVSVEWEVVKNLHVESDVSQDAHGEVGVSWRWDY